MSREHRRAKTRISRYSSCRADQLRRYGRLFMGFSDAWTIQSNGFNKADEILCSSNWTSLTKIQRWGSTTQPLVPAETQRTSCAIPKKSLLSSMGYPACQRFLRTKKEELTVRLRQYILDSFVDCNGRVSTLEIVQPVDASAYCYG